MTTNTLSDSKPSFIHLVGIALVIRLVVGTGLQIFGPFLTTMASGLGVSVIVMGQLVGLQIASGLTSPLFGVLAERVGYRPVMRGGLLAAAVGLFVLGGSQSVWVAIVGMLLTGVGFFCFVPLIQAYLSKQLPDEQRASGMTIVEYSWALSAIIGLFLMGKLIEAAGWRAPFFVLGVGLLIGWFLLGFLPPVEMAIKPTERESDLSFYEKIRAYLNLNRSAWAVCAVQGMISFSFNNLLLVYGVWFESEYELSIAELGTVGLLVGVAFLFGGVTVSLIVNHLGGRRTLLWGVSAAMLACFMLPFFNIALIPALVGLFLATVCLEFSSVGSVPFLSQQLPEQPGKILTLGLAMALIGSTIGSFTGPWAYTEYGVSGPGTIAGLAMLVGVGMIVGWVREIEK